MRHYKNLILRHKVDVVRCVATSAIRSASNGGDVIVALSKTLGFPVRVISGDEEAETIFRAISAVSTLPETRVLACDMGGGSLELMAGQRTGLEHAISVNLGASRLAREMDVSDPLSTVDITHIESKCDELFKEFSREYPPDLFSHLVASSGTLTAIINMARSEKDGYISPPLSLSTASAQEIADVCDELITRDPTRRRKLAGYDDARDEFIATAAVIARRIATLVAADASWMISPYALREGIAFRIADQDEYEGPSQSDVARSTVDDLEHRMSVFTPTKKTLAHPQASSILVAHGNHVQSLAHQLFDGLASLHKLTTADRVLLGYASRLHDIGETISHSKHDQHGAYILSSIPLVGFSPEDAAVLRGIIRWHRTRKPKKSDRYVGQLSEQDFSRASWLAAIVRIADGADAGKSLAVSHISISVKPDVIYLRFSSHRDCELELYSARRKRTLLEMVSDRDVIIQQEHSDQQREQG